MNDQNYTPEVIDVTPAIPMRENGKPLKKREYLFSAAPMKTRITSFVALGLAALFALLIVIGAIVALNTPIWEVPLFTMTVEKDELRRMENQIEDLQDEIKDAIRSDDDEVIDELEDRFDMKIKDIEKAFKNPSLVNMSTLFVGIGESEAALAAGFLMALAIGGAIFVLLFAGLAMLFLKKGLLIAAYIFAIPFFLLFTGTGMMIAEAIVLVAFIVVQSIVNKAYKTYKKSLAK